MPNSKGIKHTIDYVRKCFEERGYNLLETEYKNNSQKLNYICNNGHNSSIDFNHFNLGRGCAKCIGRDLYKLEDVIKYFEKHDCKLLTTEYINMSQKLEYICSCGEKNKITFTKFRRYKKGCIKCYGIKMRHKIEDVKKLFTDNGCTLLETEYHNNDTNMRYICNCGNESKITYINFHRGQRCFKCGQEKKEETSLKNYGVSYPSQSPIIREKIEKSRKLWKDYTMPSGKIVRVQGYEKMGIDDLLAEGIAEDNIDVHCKTIKKEFIYHYNNLYRSYFPDFYIINTNTIIEIKSEYIYMKEQLQNIQKEKYCIALGYEFEFWIYNKKRKEY